MFTGIISNSGTIETITPNDGGLTFVISCNENDFFGESNIGDSVAVNGVCLTVTELTENSMTTFAQIETIDKTTLGNFVENQNVNLEHPLRFNDRLGGHLVQGHVDGVAKVSKIDMLKDGSQRVTIAPPLELTKYTSVKGSITLDGVSLTVASIDDANNTFDIALIPATIEHTQFKNYVVGTKMNIEVDAIARMVERLLNK